ncbi:hypothetical protein DE146DRAFT_641590 [Phaeosphaeria sp. MPI-PUGE-AT-0046c]|nr:hypothetical protein DE146DRAFT_641590 [Phaeosphaeria sp. MPI-PUGE-AT-0046c]
MIEITISIPLTALMITGLACAAMFEVRPSNVSCWLSLLTQSGTHLQHGCIRMSQALDPSCIIQRHERHSLSLHSNFRNVKHQVSYIHLT